MSLDPYSSCMCGSGKKFKWCCAPFHQAIDRAFAQLEEGQNENALRTINEVVTAHPDHPEPLGRKALLLYQLGQADEAEATLQKALDLNPQYPFGHFLRGRFRQVEGEIPGALLQFRKAVDLYDPSAHDMLTTLYALIAECELKLNRPVAGRAAFELALRHHPTDQGLRKGIEDVFGSKAQGLPEAARREYTFLPQTAASSAERKAAWQNALSAASTGKLSDVVKAFESLTANDDKDAAAWFNLGLARAWLGDNLKALEALDRYVSLETDDARAETTWALAEVLRCGYGMEAEADYVENSASFEVRDPNRVGQWLRELEAERRLAGTQVREQEGVISALIMEKTTALTPELAASKPARLGAFLLIAGPLLRLWNSNKERFEATLADFRQSAVGSVSGPHIQQMPVPFAEVLSDGFVFPRGVKDENVAKELVRQHLGNYLEETWIHRPLRSLSGVPPIDASGHAVLKRKLRGVVKFLQECESLTLYGYDFDRLRRKLGLLAGGGAAPATGAADVSALGAPELTALKVEELGDEQLEQAYQAAMKLDAKELAGHFAKALVARPANPQRPDRFPFFTQLINFTQADGKFDEALDLVNQGEKQDSDQNEGRRRNDYVLRRAQVHMKRGDIDNAALVFDELIAGASGELRYRASAAEAMLSAKQAGRAKTYAEQGLAQARQKNDRDSEQHFLELAAAAKKQGG